MNLSYPGSALRMLAHSLPGSTAPTGPRHLHCCTCLSQHLLWPEQLIPASWPPCSNIARAQTLLSTASSTSFLKRKSYPVSPLSSELFSGFSSLREHLKFSPWPRRPVPLFNLLSHSSHIGLPATPSISLFHFFPETLRLLVPA